MIAPGAGPTATIAATPALEYKDYTAGPGDTVLLSTALSVQALAGALALVP
jgi:hypothetical protein